MLFRIGLFLIFIGFFLTFISLILMSLKSVRGRVTGGGILMIGPIPIIFGREGRTLIVLAILAIVLMLIVSFLMIMPPRI